VIRRRLNQRDAEEVAQRQRIRRTPRDAALRVDALEVANQQQADIDPRRQPRSAHLLGVERRTLRFREVVKSTLTQQLIQSRVERVTRGCREVRHRHPHGRLSVALAFAHRHAQSLVPLQ
jgi:hypothetical protein